jgi:Arc/MetJ-type ribon-helix-helix transcriptional regulator
MVSKTSRLNLRVSSEVIDLLGELSERKGYGTISDVVREALERYAEEEAGSWNSEMVKVQIPKGAMDAVETLVMAGDATDVQQAINFALRDWIQSQTAYHLEDRDALEKKIGEELGERAIKERLKSEQRR